LDGSSAAAASPVEFTDARAVEHWSAVQAIEASPFHHNPQV
jgi:hypothetical protein